MQTLEKHYRDMQDVEFTIEEGTLYMLQTRSAKRPAQAAVRVAVDMVSEGLLTKEEALQRIDADKLDALMHPTFDPAHKYEPLARGVPASPGAAKGAIVFTAEEAVERAAKKEAVILVRPFTEADDVAGFHAAKGILTSEGGKASHAALVARGMGRPCIAGASDLHIDVDAGTVSVNGEVLHAGDLIAINGTTGEITTEDVPLVPPRIEKQFETVLRWADEFRRLGVRANADNAEDADEGAQLRCRGHRALPDRAHVPRRPRPEGEGDDHGPRGTRDAAPRARRAASAPAGRLREPVRGRWLACPSRSGCSTRRSTSSCRTRRI